MAVAAVAAGAFFMMRPQKRPVTAPPAVADAKMPLPEIASRLPNGDSRALAAIYERVMARQDGIARGLSEAEGQQWLDIVTGLRTGYPRFGAYARASALMVTGRILDKFAIEPAPSCWVEILAPSHDLYSAGLADNEVNVRVMAMSDIARLWVWSPGRSLTPVEEKTLADWKEAFHTPVVQQLADMRPVLRAAAVACLSELPIESAAAPAVAYLNDPSAEVRGQVILAFGDRPSLVSDEMLLRHLADSDRRIPTMVERVLKGRGLTQEQIGLGGMIVHSRPEVRESVIPLVKDRTDIDPVTWLVYLSRDELDTVRMKAFEALAGRDSPDARQRLAEMAISDPSIEVKKMAGRLIFPGEETASVPPLPGSSSLTPKAN